MVGIRWNKQLKGTKPVGKWLLSTSRVVITFHSFCNFMALIILFVFVLSMESENVLEFTYMMGLLPWEPQGGGDAAAELRDLLRVEQSTDLRAFDPSGDPDKTEKNTEHSHLGN